MKIKELHEKTSKELSVEKDRLIKEHKEIRFKKVMSIVENPVKLRVIRRDIARINTILHERDLNKIKEELNK
jgi:large subunit ribosomal protein L29